MEHDLACILDVVIFGKRILEFTVGMNKEEFENDIKTQSAVLFQISILGEAMRRLSPEFREKYPEIPYTKIIGMRNKLVHDYDHINLNITWDVINTAIPQLLLLLENIVPSENENL